MTVDKRTKAGIVLLTYAAITVLEIFGFLGAANSSAESEKLDLTPFVDASLYFAIGFLVITGLFALMSSDDMALIAIHGLPVAIVAGFFIYGMGIAFSGNLPTDVWSFLLTWGIYTLWSLSPAFLIMGLYLDDKEKVFQ